MTENCSNLQDLVEQWGKAFSKHHGTTCKWVDLHAKRPEMKDEQKHKISAKVENVRYEKNENVIDVPGILDKETLSNTTSLIQTTNFTHSKSTTSSFTWTMKEGIDIGISLQFSVGVAPAASVSTTMTASVSAESTQSKTKTNTDTWAVNQDVKVKPNTKVDVIWAFHKKEFSAKFYADVILNGYVAIWNNDKIDIKHDKEGKDLHFLYFIPLCTAFEQMKKWGVDIPPQYEIRGEDVVYHASGEFEGEAGIEAHIELKERK